MTKKSYHHGNLREALLNAALHILSTDGVDGVSLRKVALKAEVSATALYTHFKDKRELLAVVAAQGFEGLSLAMLKQSKGIDNTADKLLGLARGYVFFAIENAPLFQLMFGKQLSNLAEFPALAEASANSYAMMSHAVTEQMKVAMGEEQSKVISGEAKIGAAAAWSMMHGLSTLINDGKITPESSGVDSIEELIRQVASMLIFAGLNEP